MMYMVGFSVEKYTFSLRFHLAPITGEPEILSASKPFAITSKKYFADADS